MLYAYTFLKAESNTLSLYYSYNYKIELKDFGMSKLKYSLLYQILTKKLKVIKAYITNNLAKRFIKLL